MSVESLFKNLYQLFSIDLHCEYGKIYQSSTHKNEFTLILSPVTDVTEFETALGTFHRRTARIKIQFLNHCSTSRTRLWDLAYRVFALFFEWMEPTLPFGPVSPFTAA